ncbi:uncharacterized protein LOC131891403 isoform X1 [Tigriopus californicus]|uniref:uncharacterized protein LOC131891403 isoform X1 n=1 Tax=Tigriopus californicus TaxID=6832 RepID=UPI0027DA6A1A|nr:uncharacterized protein LOC131891403 isoform X1 [Tigriopus californicus]
MKIVRFLAAMVGIALTEDLKCYSCKDANQYYVPCGGAVREKLELCGTPLCANWQIINGNNKVSVWKGCGVFRLTDVIDYFFPVNTLLGVINRFVNLNQCIDLSSARNMKDGSSVCFCTASGCNGAIGQQI